MPLRLDTEERALHFAKPISESLAGETGHQGASDDAFLAALRARDAVATKAFFQRYAPYARCLLLRVLGPCAEVPDLVHDVFVEAFDGIAQVRQPEALKSWVASIVIHVARGHIRRKRRRWWLLFAPSEEIPEIEDKGSDGDGAEAVRAVYAALDKLGAEERIVFTLRVIDEMPLADVAASCGVSLATAKRRIAKAEERFARLCEHDPLLRDRVARRER